MQGAEQIQHKLPEAISIFILPPNRQELEKRLRRRSSAERMTDEAVIQRRLETATREIEKYEEYDYILVNDQLSDSIDSLKAIILIERLKAEGRKPSAQRGRADGKVGARAGGWKMSGPPWDRFWRAFAGQTA